MRPTGRLHLGHFFGALSNWLKLQEEYDCFFFVADWHALTTHYEDTSSIAENTLQVATDWLSVGLDPSKSTLFVQSQILEHAELHLLLSMITPLSWLERVPTYKEQIENLKDRDLGTYGFLGYPLLQSADIVMYGKPKQDLLVPVGEDQAPHVELTREIVRRFNTQMGIEVDADALRKAGPEVFEQARQVMLDAPMFLSDSSGSGRVQSQQEAEADFEKGLADGSIDAALLSLQTQLRRAIAASGFDNILAKHPVLRRFVRRNHVLTEPKYLLTETPRLPGTDGRRMAKSYGNAIWLSDPPEEIRTKARNMMTDPQRVRRTDPGRPEVCPVFAYHKLFSTPETIAQVDRDCRTAAIGCVDCKKLMADALVKWIEPIQTQRKKYEANPKEVWDILDAGSNQARKMAKKTMRRVREAIFKWDEAREERPLGRVARSG
jgi:tryptophanyl-tRNA synthetase